ncbi:hypothetical protein COU18_01785 [Candidatus Kaiserbacteria bacterium CG10_big_fil_rev_8_21_14_0_10_51_14]|uniref:DUF5671 domain-containing protein n=1 Tax=Candidatus Kaiserbacteria bacterium CG10_big_fil_rev_8_21_14_0_10_51_14 TaxID=1974610 RepID=A0A2H0UCG4_9BACT|nr:MAG: hypothetical protein COU18_01785 [Candidatus Kaiserbacteria bacterium CG10_big_fil_rev_8_21_14_0_10_51_14]
MEKAKITPKDFVLWVAAMAALYSGVFAFIRLVFDYINQVFPNPITNAYYYYDPYGGGVSYEMAALIVLTPVFLILMRTIRKDIKRDHSRREVWIRRWALFLTIALAAATMVIDLIVLIHTFLQGEDLTVGFLLKVAVVLLVAGAGFFHFLADLRGYWEKEPGRAKMINWAVGVLVLVTIVAGFFIIGTPQEIRAKKQDAVRINDLQGIQWQVVNYWQQKETIPTALADLSDPLMGYMLPVDPKTAESYEYKKTGNASFELCATFATEGGNTTNGRPMPVDPSMGKGITPDSWQHAAGRVCFTRTIDPERYPPYTKTL